MGVTLAHTKIKPTKIDLLLGLIQFCNKALRPLPFAL